MTPRMARTFPLRIPLRGKARGARPCAPVRRDDGPPDRRPYPAHPLPSAVPGPGADLTRHPASKIRRGHPVRAPFGALARNLAVRGRAVRGPEKTTHLGPVLPLPSVLGEPLWARAAKPVLLIREVLIKASFRRRPESRL